MDLQIAIACVAVAAISAFLFYISFSKKPTFEEVKANRRKIMKQFQEENKNTYSDKSKDKKSKKINKKKNEKKDINKDSEVDLSEVDTKKESSQAKTSVSASNNPPVIINKIVNKKKKILPTQESVQKSNESSENADTQQNIIDSADEKPISKDIKKKAKKDNEKVKDEKKVQSERNEDQIVQAPSNNMQSDKHESHHQPSAAPSTSHPPKPKPSKKKRTEINSLNQLKNDNQAVSYQVLVNLIQKAELSGSEIQTLIERLLNKQQDDTTEWFVDRQDPVVKLKKQLNDTEQALKDEKEITIGLQAKLKELRQEIINDRQITRSAEEQIHILQNELRSMTNKLNTITEEKNALNINIQQLQKRVNDNELLLQTKEDQIMKQRLNDEKNQETIINLQAQVNQLTAQIQENVRVIEEYQKMNADMTRAYESSQFSAQELQAQIKNMERSLSEAKIDVENQTKTNNSLFEQNEQLSNQLKTQCQEINALKEKNESLTSKLNSENFENGISCNKQEFVELEARLEEKNHQIDKLTKEIEYSKTIIQDLNNCSIKDKNDLINNEALLEKANNEILLLKEKINMTVQEDAINQLKNSLNERNQEIASLKHEIEMCKEKNNELRNKNWKIVDALTKAEKALQNKIRNEQSEGDETNVDVTKIHERVNKLMKNLYPDLNVESNQDNTDDWLDNLEKSVMSRITQAASNKQSLPELQTHNSHLQSLVIHYKGIITEAEKMLNQLQKKVEIEEARWKAKVKSLEESLAKMRSSQTSEMFLQP